MPSVIVQEQRPLLRHGIAALLQAVAAIQVLHVVADGPALLVCCASSTPDVVFLELAPAGWDIDAVVRDLRKLVPGSRLAGLHHGRRGDVEPERIRLGLDDIVSYGAGASALLDVVQPGLVEHLDAPLVERRWLPARDLLTPREREVLRHIAAGLTTHESAVLLDLRPKTVENHKQRIFTKLGVQNQAHAVALGHRMGILQSHPVLRRS